MTSSITLKPEESRIVATVFNFLAKGNRKNAHAHVCRKIENGNISILVSISEEIIFDVLVDPIMKKFGIRYDGDTADYYWSKIIA